MQIIFHKWCQYLKMKDLGKFLSLYSVNCHIVSNIKNNNYKDTILLPTYQEPYQKTRIGALKTFENILFSPHRSFDIEDLDIKFCDKSRIIHGSCKFLYKGDVFNTRHTMFLSKEKNNEDITFHYTDYENLK